MFGCDRFPEPNPATLNGKFRVFQEWKFRFCAHSIGNIILFVFTNNRICSAKNVHVSLFSVLIFPWKI
jgi:hypothetical protein